MHRSFLGTSTVHACCQSSVPEFEVEFSSYRLEKFLQQNIRMSGKMHKRINLLGCDIIQSGRPSSMFQRNTLLAFFRVKGALCKQKSQDMHSELSGQ
jgi:hypothetical protein